MLEGYLLCFPRLLLSRQAIHESDRIPCSSSAGTEYEQMHRGLIQASSFAESRSVLRIWYIVNVTKGLYGLGSGTKHLGRAFKVLGLSVFSNVTIWVLKKQMQVQHITSRI